MIRMSIVALGLLCASAGCGGTQQTGETEGTPVERPPCVDALWEVPPDDIGQNPPSRQAGDDVLAPFEGEGSGP